MIASTSSAQGNVVSWIENDFSFGKNSIVFDFCFSDGGAIVGEDDKFCFTCSKGSEG